MFRIILMTSVLYFSLFSLVYTRVDKVKESIFLALLFMAVIIIVTYLYARYI